MSVFDTYSDSPFQIKNEGQEITVNVARTSPTTLQVSWNLPAIVQCGQNGAYNGALITVDQTPTSQSKLPVDGTIYSPDATADPNLNAGDRIGSALVIGAFYNDTTTCSFDISDAPDNIPFYVSLHAVDAEYRYHTAGVHSYSLQFGKDTHEKPTSGYHEIKLGTPSTPDHWSGVTYTTSTNLNPSSTYNITVFSDKKEHGYHLSVIGSTVPTYGTLLDSLNLQVINDLNPITTENNEFPGTGYYWYDSANRVVNLWDTTKNVNQFAIILGQDPINASNGKLWYDSTSKDLYQYAVDTGWTQTDYYAYPHDPRQPFCDDYWYRESIDTMYRWSGVIWETVPFDHQVIDPTLPDLVNCASYWFDGTNLYHRDDSSCIWDEVPYVAYDTDFAHPTEGMLWVDTVTKQLSQWTNGVWMAIPTFTTLPKMPTDGCVYLNPVDFSVQFYSTAAGWVSFPDLPLPYDPTTPPEGTIWKQGSLFFIWDILSATWVQLDVTTSATDPTCPHEVDQGTVWYDGVLFSKYVGTSWCDITPRVITSEVKPQSIASMIWYNTQNNTWQQLANGMMSSVTPITAAFAPADIQIGQLWYNPTTNQLWSWNGSGWNTIPVNTTPFVLNVGTVWYNTSTKALMQWNGKAWIPIEPNIIFSLSHVGSFLVTSTTKGSRSYAVVDFKTQDSLMNSVALATGVHFMHPKKGTDPVSTVPSYMELGVGTDGSADERRNLVSQLKSLLGYPIIEVELTKEQIDVAIDNALMELRYKSGLGYKRGVFFLDVEPHLQHYILSDATVGFNKIVDVLYLYRMTSAYLGTGIGAGIYGQIAIQQLYTYGKFDLVSYHLVAGYIELMKQLFATEVQFSWDEYSRKLSIYKDFFIRERVLVDAVVEKTEQELLVDRWSAKWIQKYALAQCRLILADIRGKYTTIVAAGGTVTLNASDLRATAEREMQECQDEIDNYIVSNKEDWGVGSDFIIG